MGMLRHPTSRLCSKIVTNDQVLGLADLASVSGSRTTRRSGGDRLLVVVAQVGERVGQIWTCGRVFSRVLFRHALRVRHEVNEFSNLWPRMMCNPGVFHQSTSLPRIGETEDYQRSCLVRGNSCSEKQKLSCCKNGPNRSAAPPRVSTMSRARRGLRSSAAINRPSS